MMHRLLITGAAGTLGREARERCVGFADVLRLSDVVDLGEPRDNEEMSIVDLSDEAGVLSLVEGCDGIVHFGGFSHEGPFQKILNANIIGIYNLYEAARAHGVKRVFFASTNSLWNCPSTSTGLPIGRI